LQSPDLFRSPAAELLIASGDCKAIKPETVQSSKAACKQNVMTGNNVDLDVLPGCLLHQGQPDFDVRHFVFEFVNWREFG